MFAEELYHVFPAFASPGMLFRRSAGDRWRRGSLALLAPGREQQARRLPAAILAKKSRSAARLPGWLGLIVDLLAVNLLYDPFEHVRRQGLGKVLADPLADIVAGIV